MLQSQGAGRITAACRAYQVEQPVAALPLGALVFRATHDVLSKIQLAFATHAAAFLPTRLTKPVVVGYLVRLSATTRQQQHVPSSNPHW